MCAFGVYCHYRGTLGYYVDGHNQLLPLFMFGAAFTVYALGPLRLIDQFLCKSIPRTNYFTYMSLLVSVKWLTIFGVTRVLNELINAIGLGWLLWYMMFISGFSVIFFNCTLTTDKDDMKLPTMIDEVKLVDGGMVFASTDTANSNSSTRPSSERNFV